MQILSTHLSERQLARHEGGFTLIELLVVIAIIGLLSSIVFTSLVSARLKARVAAGQAADSNNYHAIGDQTLGEWLFSDCTGNTLTDTSGTKHNGILMNSPTWSASGGPNGKCYLTFNGTSNYVPIGPITTGLTLTYGMWIKITSLPTSPQILLWDDDWKSGGDTYILLNSNGTIGTSYGLTSTRSINTGEWVFIAITGNSSGSSVYINGAPSGQTSALIPNRTGLSFVTLGVSCGGDPASSPPLCSPMVPYGGMSSPYFTGSIGELRIYSAALSLGEIHALYAQTKPANIATR